jgi:hypothetical protein
MCRYVCSLTLHHISHGCSVIATKPKAEEKFPVAAMLLFYILREIRHRMVHIFQRSITIDYIKILN